MIMIAKSLLKRGYDHELNCEDAVSINRVETYFGNLHFLAVFDGCCGGIKSQFASEFLSKAFKYAVSSLNFDEIDELSFPDLIYFIINRLKEQLQTLQFNINISEYELLSTVVFSIISEDLKYGCIVFFGDGVAIINGKDKIIIDQNNMPDYLAYHINEDTDTIIKNNANIYYFNNITDLSICTDGILSFSKIIDNDGIKTNVRSDEITNDVIDSLCINTDFSNNEIMLTRKYNILHKNNYHHYDDIAIARLFI